jgi:hypothetical protein
LVSKGAIVVAVVALALGGAGVAYALSQQGGSKLPTLEVVPPVQSVGSSVTWIASNLSPNTTFQVSVLTQGGASVALGLSLSNGVGEIVSSFTVGVNILGSNELELLTLTGLVVVSAPFTVLP